MEIQCPQCGVRTTFSPANPFRPFCSDRCRLIDLGAWADGSYAVPSEEKISIQDLPSSNLRLEDDDES